jgi:hypothetical protein
MVSCQVTCRSAVHRVCLVSRSTMQSTHMLLSEIYSEPSQPPLYPQEVTSQPPGAVSTYAEGMSIQALYAWSTIDRPESQTFLRSIAANGLRLRNASARDLLLYEPTENLDTHIARALNHVERFGSWEIGLINVVTLVEEDNGRAQVWVTTRMGMPRSGQTVRGREVVSRFNWRYCKRAGRWLWSAYDGIRGPGWNLF